VAVSGRCPLVQLYPARSREELARPVVAAGVASMEMVECSLAATLAPRTLPGRVRKAPPRPAVLAGRARLRVRSARREQPPPPEPVAVRGASGTGHGGRAVRQAAAGLAAAAVVSLTGFAGDVSPLPTPPARAESLTVAFPVAKAREVNRVQRTLVEAWGLIRETFVDPTFNHQGIAPQFCEMVLFQCFQLIIFVEVK